MPTVGEHLTARLKSEGVNKIFGIAGDYVLPYYQSLDKDKDIEIVSTCDEASAGFAADAYARVKGLGAVCVTYCVGGFKLINSIAGAYAEQSPVVVISGAPGLKERNGDMLLHHMVGTYSCQYDIFKNITCDSAILDDPTRAGYLIDKVIESAKRYKQPVYLELPRDVINKPISYNVYTKDDPQSPKSNESSLIECIDEVLNWIKEAKNPVIWAGIEVARYNFANDIIRFAQATGIPLVADLLSKSVVNESHPLYAGVYNGIISRESTRQVVENSDCLIILGTVLSDINLGFKPTIYHKKDKVITLKNKVQIKNHVYEKVYFPDFIKALCESRVEKKNLLVDRKEVASFEPQLSTPITVKRTFELIDSILNENMTVIADVGDSLFGASDLTMHGSNMFLSQAFYTSMGFAIPAALGVQKALPGCRPIVIVGDGAFQMTGMELSSIIRHKLNPIIFLLNNEGYGTERHILLGKFDDIHNWDYHNLPSVFGGGKGYRVENEMDLFNAVKESLSSDEPSLINIILNKMDASPALKRITESLAKRL